MCFMCSKEMRMMDLATKPDKTFIQVIHVGRKSSEGASSSKVSFASIIACLEVWSERKVEIRQEHEDTMNGLQASGVWVDDILRRDND